MIAQELRGMRSGVVPEDVKDVNRAEHKHMLDTQILGLLVSRAAAEGVDGEGFEEFAKRHMVELVGTSNRHPVPIDERIAKAAGRYLFR